MWRLCVCAGNERKLGMDGDRLVGVRACGAEAAAPTARRRSAASRAAAFHNARSPSAADAKTNDNGLMGRGKAAPVASTKTKRYSKKNKPGTAAAALGS